MRKYIIAVCLLQSFSFFANAQSWEEDMIEARKLVDSFKNELNYAKGEKRVDYLNLLADTYYWIWEDNIKHLDSACMYATHAYNEAKKFNYKNGLGYGLLHMAQCTRYRTDENKNDNDAESAYLLSEKQVQEAIKIGEETENYRLVGSGYSYLKGVAKGKGDQTKYKTYLQKAIFYYEKPVKKPLKGLRGVATCSKCQGNEILLGNAYRDLAAVVATENINNPEAANEQIEKAIHYYTMSGWKASIGNMYMEIAESVTQLNDLEAGIIPFKKAIVYFQNSGNAKGVFDAHIRICRNYWNLGDFENGLNIARRVVILGEDMIKRSYTGSADSARLSQAYYWVARFYEIAGDYTTSFTFLNKARIFIPADRSYETPLLVALGELHRKAGNYDSAKVYLIQFEKKDGGKPMLANLYVSLKQYDDAIRIIGVARGLSQNRNNRIGMGKNLLTMANAYLGKNNLDQALTNARQGVELLGQMKRNVYMPDGYKVLSDVFEKLGKTDSAFHYFKKYSSLKDSLLNRQFYFRLSDYKKEAEDLKRISQINLLEKDNLLKAQQLQQQLLLSEQNEAQLSLLDKDNEIKNQQLTQESLIKEQSRSLLTVLDKENKLKDQQLKQQAFIRNALLGGLLLFILLGVFIFRSISLKRKNEKLAISKTQSDLMQKMSELEMQALRAQMNPHFIFNCLSSINRFILKNESKIASNYLTRFSRLMRMVLNNSQKPLISLDDELEMLELYLEMERLRFKNSFDYGITFLNTVDSDNVFIPPLLLQPFCENAIWHGLMNKEGQGRLDIELSMENNILNCVIADNGVGREKAEELKSKTAEKEKSMGLKITTERLALLNREKGLHTFYEIEDLKDDSGKAAGTKVILKTSFKESVAELV